MSIRDLHTIEITGDTLDAVRALAAETATNIEAQGNRPVRTEVSKAGGQYRAYVDWVEGDK